MAINWHFAAMVLASLLAFYGIVVVALRGRPRLPSRQAIGVVAAIVVGGGMLFAKGGASAGWPVWLYYGVPAGVTCLLPPLAFRMVVKEAAQYLVLAVLVAPVFHVLFSLVLGWKEYMPFIPVPSLRDWLGIAA